MPKFKVGDRVWTTEHFDFRSSTIDRRTRGEVVGAANASSGYDYYVSFDGGPTRVPVREREIEFVNEIANPSPLEQESPSSIPNYYLLPTGVQVIDVTRWLTGNAAQAVQYIARSSRVDEVYKGDRVKDLRKALDFINNEIERLELDDE